MTVSMPQDSIPISVIIPTWQREQSLATALSVVFSQTPRPKEVIVHVDAGDRNTELMLRHEFPSVQVIKSDTTVGPGGGA